MACGKLPAACVSFLSSLQVNINFCDRRTSKQNKMNRDSNNMQYERSTKNQKLLASCKSCACSCIFLFFLSHAKFETVFLLSSCLKRINEKSLMAMLFKGLEIIYFIIRFSMWTKDPMKWMSQLTDYSNFHRSFIHVHSRYVV